MNFKDKAEDLKQFQVFMFLFHEEEFEKHYFHFSHWP